ncbi:F-box domain-containing protein [Caenorhabditis elegans]|uniref:F-box domain-containing protein n=1 Tax=Caenorhabditis elegans TaxID=6239 RepID=O17165_CAEEL|nr:F-box domain-containing protein [Caenorhabditis elegans]CCD62826.2 F-box domain-containing protein [Caenorhabditis elegans]|eukprot:NP_493736.2 Uncharacterized protein CELE_C24H12.1 [Caenorhabditis elegans]
MLLDYLLLLIITAFLIIAVIKIKLKKKPFHLRKLPHVAFRNVLNSMDINKVIDLSMKSTRFRRRLKQVNRKIFNLIIERYEIYSSKLGEDSWYRRIIVMETERDMQFAYHFMMNKARIEGYDWATHEDINDHISFFCTEYKKVNKSPCLSYGTSQELTKLLDILNGSFLIDHVELTMERDEIFGEFKSALSHPLFRKCHFVKLLGDDSYISTEDMEFILKNFDLKYGFSNNCLHRAGFNKKLWVNIPRLDFQNFFTDASLTVDELKMMNCERIRFDYLYGSSGVQLNKYVRYWLAGNMSKLRRFQLNFWNDRWTDDLWNGLPHSSEWNPKRRARFFYDDLEVVDCSKGRDIERSDGLLATVLIESRTMYFLI